MSRLTFLFLLLIWAAFPLQAQTGRADPPVWIVRDADSVVHMVGTVHMMRGEDRHIGLYADLVAKSDEVWLEIAGLSEPPPEMMGQMMRYGLSPDRPLSEVLDEAELAALSEVLEGYGTSLESYEDMRPWFVYLQLTGLLLAEAGFDPAQGLDVHIERMAESRDVPVYGFESFESQFRLFAEMDEETQAQLLLEVVFEADEAVDELIASLDAWTTGDLAPLEDVLAEMRAEAPEFYNALLVDRNHGFADGIEEILAGEGRALVAVGLAHFAGPDSIPAILEARGYSVEYR
jgi:uncharacterized protein